MLVLAKIAMSLVRAKSRPDQLIESPTLVITGGAHRMPPSHCSEILAEKIPKAKLIEVQGGLMHCLLRWEADSIEKC